MFRMATKSREGRGMKINVFEGARRVAKLLGGLWAIGCLSFAIFAEPYSRIIYAVPSLNAPPVLVEKCFDEDATEYVSPRTPDGRSVNVLLCFVAHTSNSGELLVPYADAGNGKVWMAGRYATEVSQYTKAVRQNFQLSAEGIEAANARRRTAMFEQWKDALLFLIGGMVAGWAFVVATGWIVRGFMGIPKGQDFRPIP
jgi:hypothetical protein